MQQIIIGVDPHKLSATIEVGDKHEQRLGSGRFTTDRAGYAAMRTYAKSWPERMWAVEGANGAGRPLAQRLLEAGEQVVDVPAKLAARVRLFDTGHNRKTDALDAHSIAIVAVRTTTLRVLQVDGQLEALRMLTDRREALTRRRVLPAMSRGRTVASIPLACNGVMAFFAWPGSSSASKAWSRLTLWTRRRVQALLAELLPGQAKKD